MKNGTKRAVALALAVAAAAVLFAGCPKKQGAAPGGGSRVANRYAENEIPALQNQSRFKTRAELREYLMKKIVCPVHNMDLKMDEKTAPDCKERPKIMMTVDRMLDTGWTIEEIEASIPLIRQGASMITDMVNEKSCEPGGGVLKLDFFLMSHCPYGLRYVDQILPAILAEFGQLIVWEPHFIVDIDAKGNVNSLHGQPEVDEDKFQICVSHDIGSATWLSYARCYATEINAVYTKAQQAGKQPPDEKTVFNNVHNTCAQRAGISPAAVAGCIKSKSLDYLRKDTELTKKWETNASPTAVFNCTKRFNGGATPYQQAKPHICGIFPEGKKPAVCAGF
jgi:hypothetical protein